MLDYSLNLCIHFVLTFYILLYHFHSIPYSAANKNNHPECPTGQYCYGPQPTCQRVKPGKGTKWCGATFDDMASQCAKECPNGTDEECDAGEQCWADSPCADQEDEMVLKKDLGTKWCGLTFDDMASKCATECPLGTDEECGPGEKCWADSPCADILSEEDVQDDEDMAPGMYWCGSSYKNLVETCPKQCPGMTDDECGDGMTCFNMSEDETKCEEEGVGIKEPVDSANLWCGTSWNDVLENCAMACPEGSDEECSASGATGLSCYDLTGNDLICKVQGFGVKEKGDPDKVGDVAVHLFFLTVLFSQTFFNTLTTIIISLIHNLFLLDVLWILL